MFRSHQRLAYWWDDKKVRENSQNFVPALIQTVFLYYCIMLVVIFVLFIFTKIRTMFINVQSKYHFWLFLRHHSYYEAAKSSALLSSKLFLYYCIMLVVIFVLFIYTYDVYEVSSESCLLEDDKKWAKMYQI